VSLPATTEPPAPRMPATPASRPATTRTSLALLRRRWKATASLLVGGAATIASILPLFAGLSSGPPSPVFDNQPFSLPFEITNHNPIPALGVSYACSVSIETDQQKLRDVVAIPIQTPRTLYWGDSMTARCENQAFLTPAFLASGVQFLSGDVRLIVNYKMPWPIPHKHERVYTAIIDPRTHRIQRWIPK
jgi:hypothetical protein